MVKLLYLGWRVFRLTALFVKLWRPAVLSVEGRPAAVLSSVGDSLSVATAPGPV